MSLLRSFWNDEAGFVVSAELVLVATVLVIGMLVGLATLRDDVIMELADTGDALSEVVQSFSFAGWTGHSSSTAGSLFADLPDFCETGAAGASSDQVLNNAVNCTATVAGTNE